MNPSLDKHLDCQEKNMKRQFFKKNFHFLFQKIVKAKICSIVLRSLKTTQNGAIVRQRYSRSSESMVLF
jgi:hypothetical protein